jgi:UDP-N-acetylmuramyl pentapeptide synthase
MAEAMVDAARGEGLARATAFKDVQSAGEAALTLVREGDLVLLKASRASRLERLTELLCKRAGSTSSAAEVRSR